MKIISFGTEGKMILIGEDPKTSKWYVVGDKVRTFIKNYKVGDEVAIGSFKKNGTDTLTYMGRPKPDQVVGNLPPEPGTIQNTPQPDLPAEPKLEATQKTFNNYNKTSYGKTPAENESIKRQAIAHATSRTIAAMGGSVDASNVEHVIEKVYNKYLEMVG